MKPSDAKLALKACFEARENIALVGPPGCGKSSIVKQAAEETDRDFVISNPSLEDSTEPGGIPWFAEDHTHALKLPFGQVWKVLNSTRPTHWHWEDFGGAYEATQKAYMQWAEAREIDGHKLPDHVSISMATNRRIDKAGVVGVLETIKGRFCMIQMESNLDDYCNNLFDRGTTEYGLTEEAVVSGAAFLRFRPNLLNAFEPTADMTNTPTERNWTHAFKFPTLGLAPHVEHQLVAGRVGDGPAAEFVSFLRIYRQLPSLDAILADPDKAIIPDNPSALYAVTVGLASKATETNFSRIGRYAERLEKKQLGEFAVLLVRDSTRRNPRVASTRAYIELASSPVGHLMQGKAN